MFGKMTIVKYVKVIYVYVNIVIFVSTFYSNKNSGIAGVSAQPNMAYGRGVGPRGGFASRNGFMLKAPLDRPQEVPSVPCQMKAISVRRQDEVKGGLSLAKTLYHVGWYTGLEHVEWCHKYDPNDPADADKLPPMDKQNCIENNALQGNIMNNVNLPMKDATKHFFSCMDSRAAYAGLGTPGGDAGELINVLNSIETIIGNPFTPDDISNFFKQYLTEMGQSGKNYFSMCSDKAAVEAWFNAAEIVGSGPLLQRWNPLDTQGRRRLLKLSIDPKFVGCKHLQNMLKNPVKYKVRKELVEGVISAFYAIYFNPFNSLRQHLLFPVMDGASSPSAVLNIQSPPSCRPLSPLIAPKVHSVTPHVGGDIKYDPMQAGGGKSSFIEVNKKNTRILRSNRADPKKLGADPEDAINTGEQVLVYHYVAVNDYRRTLAEFFSRKFGLHPDIVLGKLNNLGRLGFEEDVKTAAAGKPHYIVSFY
jgi:hypothetical protein